MNNMEKLAIGMLGKLLLGAGLLGGGAYIMRGKGGSEDGGVAGDLFVPAENTHDGVSALGRLPLVGTPQDLANKIHDDRVVRELEAARAVLGERFR